MTQHITLEARIIKLSIWTTLIVGVFGIVIAYYSNSISVFIDTIYTIVAFLVYLFTLYAIKKISLPPNENYNYGYFKIEPIAVGAQALLLLAIVVLSIIMATIRFSKTEVFVAYGTALLYTSGSVIICFTMYLIVKNAATKADSNILLADSYIWWVDGWLSCGVLIGFIIAYVSQLMSLTLISRYADPVIAVMIAIFIMFWPIKLLKSSFKDLLDASPGKCYKLFCEACGK